MAEKLSGEEREKFSVKFYTLARDLRNLIGKCDSNIELYSGFAIKLNESNTDAKNLLKACATDKKTTTSTDTTDNKTGSGAKANIACGKMNGSWGAPAQGKTGYCSFKNTTSDQNECNTKCNTYGDTVIGGILIKSQFTGGGLAGKPDCSCHIQFE